MDRRVMIFSAAIAAALSCSAFWIGAAEPGTMNSAEGVDPAPHVSEVPVDAALPGAAGLIAVGSGLKGTVAPLDRAVRICGEVPAGWVRSESARLAGSRGSASVQVAAWRAGAGAQAFKRLQSAAGKCLSVKPTDGVDNFSATSSNAGGAVSVVARRYGDVLVLASVSSFAIDPAVTGRRLIKSAGEVITPRLLGVCADPGSTTVPDAASRDPYSVGYSGYRMTIRVPLPTGEVVPRPLVKQLRRAPVAATWRSPGARAFPMLAPVLPLPPGTPATPGADINAAARGPVPQLVDPALIAPPKGSAPRKEIKKPELPSPPQIIEEEVAAVDSIGPGCGWSFAGTVPPIEQGEVLEAKAQEQLTARLAKATRQQGEDLVATLEWPSRYREWIKYARNDANWRAYYAATASARAKLAEAQANHARSVAVWQSQVATGVPVLPPAPAVPVTP